MKRKNILYGLTGFLSLLGFLGVFTEEKTFCAFFAFAVDFKFFFVKSDEMLDEYMRKSAALAFYCGMAAVAVATLISFFTSERLANRALISGLAAGWVVCVLVHAVSTAFYGFREQRGLADD